MPPSVMDARWNSAFCRQQGRMGNGRSPFRERRLANLTLWMEQRTVNVPKGTCRHVDRGLERVELRYLHRPAM